MLNKKVLQSPKHIKLLHKSIFSSVCTSSEIDLSIQEIANGVWQYLEAGQSVSHSDHSY